MVCLATTFNEDKNLVTIYRLGKFINLSSLPKATYGFNHPPSPHRMITFSNADSPSSLYDNYKNTIIFDTSFTPFFRFSRTQFMKELFGLL